MFISQQNICKGHTWQLQNKVTKISLLIHQTALLSYEQYLQKFVQSIGTKKNICIYSLYISKYQQMIIKIVANGIPGKS